MQSIDQVAWLKWLNDNQHLGAALMLLAFAAHVTNFGFLKKFQLELTWPLTGNTIATGAILVTAIWLLVTGWAKSCGWG